MLKKLMPCVGRYKVYAVLAPIMMLIEVAMEVLLPIVMKEIIDNGISAQNTEYCLRMGLLMIGMSLFPCWAARCPVNSPQSPARALQKA